MDRDRGWIAPAMGILFFVLIAASFALGGEGKDPAESTPSEVLEYISDNETELKVSAVLLAFAMVPFLFFAGHLRRVLYDAQANPDALPTIAWGGALVLAVGSTAAASLGFALAEYVKDVEPAAADAMNAISYGFFLPFPVGMSVLLLASGISAVRSGVLPRWLAWIAIVLGVLSLAGEPGFFAVLLGLVWIVATSVVLTARARRAKPPQPPPPTAAST
jgi:hypothetical protein